MLGVGSAVPYSCLVVLWNLDGYQVQLPVVRSHRSGVERHLSQDRVGKRGDMTFLLRAVCGGLD
jgi:hypothetical protein